MENAFVFEGILKQNTKPHEVDLCPHCKGNIFQCSVKDGILTVEACPHSYTKEDDFFHPIKLEHADKTSIGSINFKQISIETLSLDSVKRLLHSMHATPNVVTAVTRFVEEFPKIKKEALHQSILENPDDKQICRPISDSDVTNINIFNRNAIFLILGKHDRSSLMEADEQGEFHDVLKRRKIKSWSEEHEIVIQGPILCDNDKLIFDSCLKLHHESGFKGITLRTSYSEIWRTLGNKSRMGSKNIDAIKRSLDRLTAVNIKISSQNNATKHYWTGGIIDTVCTEESLNQKYSKIVIKFNTDLVKVYLSGAYSTLKMESILKLKSYPRRMLEFLVTHEDPQKTIGINKWREIMGIDDDVQNFTFKQRLKEAISELKQGGHLTENSGFIKNRRGEGMIFTELITDNPKNKDL